MTTAAQHRDVLSAAVAALGGVHREGQVAMADAVTDAFESGVHTLIQAGTGTGKSLGYLAPVLVHCATTTDRVVIATATLALQAQLAKKDIPTALDAVEKVLGKRPRTEVLKGRTNYACLLKTRDGAGDDRQGTLLGGLEVVEAVKGAKATPESILGAEVVALREWAEDQAAQGLAGDRDDAPPHVPRAWEQVSMPVRECLGVQRCPYGAECLVEASRERARQADLVVTNHALLAIDAMHGQTALPEHQIVVIDEAHDLVSRVTGAASDELSPQLVERIARRALPWLDDDLGVELLESGDALRVALEGTPLGRITEPGTMTAAFDVVREVTRRAVSALQARTEGKQTLSGEDAERSQTAAAVKEIFDIAERMAALKPADVVWTSERERFGRWAHVAPLSVAGLMRDAVMGSATVVLTSATLTVGGEFENLAAQVGLSRRERVVDPQDVPEDVELPWRGLDVGSPFDYRRQGILYVAADLPNPGREGMDEALLAEIAELVGAAGGRTLGLFASQRNAEAAARHVRAQLPAMTILCQGDAQLSELTRRFVAEPEACLFGTLSLWQGIDVPGETCELVIIDKIPFPRPDDPLMQARQQAVVDAGGNGFMAVAASHAALLLAQGSGRLIRRSTDRGVVAILDPRLLKARYGSFLRASMPHYWMTADREIAVQALRRLQEGR